MQYCVRWAGGHRRWDDPQWRDEAKCTGAAELIAEYNDHHTNLNNPHTNRFCMVTPIVSIKYRHFYQFCYVKIFSTNQHGNLVLLDDPGRVRSQITNVERFDFDCNLV